jgi:uncharacterized RDD family membrane protein YckC
VTGGWQAPPDEPGPTPGLVFGGFGPRLVAYVVDVVISGLLSLVVLFLATVVAFAGGGPGGGILGAFLGVLLFLAITLGYFPWFWATSGATPGMKLFGLRVVRDRDGGRISVGQAVLRLFGYWVSGLVFYLGYIWIFIDRRKRGWHDLIAGTVVVQTRA